MDIIKQLELQHRETIVTANTLITKPFDNQKTQNMSNKKQTAVEWLAEQMLWNEFHNPYFEQAKEMEKEQIETAFEKGFSDGSQDFKNDMDYINDYADDFGKQYYNKTYEN